MIRELISAFIKTGRYILGITIIKVRL